MLIDTHCHMSESEYDDLDAVVTDILGSEVKKIIVSGYDVESSNKAVALAHKHENVYATVGFHPHDCGQITDDSYKLFDKWLGDSKVVGIGEIGLDYYYDIKEKEIQIEMFTKQLAIAKEHNKPVVIHNRDASQDIYDIIKDSGVKGIIHCFNDSLEMANKFIKAGFLLGIGGIITFKKNNLKDVIKDIPIEYIVLETDSPYLSPEPFRGRLNSPKNLPLVAHAVSGIKGITYNEVASVTTVNAERLFDLE